LDKVKTRAEVYTRYPISSVLIYNGTTILHYLFGGFGIIFGYNFSQTSYFFGFLYLAFAFLQMYLLMPLIVCSHCVYYRMERSLCVSGLNVISMMIAKEGNPQDFSKRGNYPSCHNILYMAALFIPIIAMIPALIINFSLILLIIFIIVLGLLLYRFFVVFPNVACVHCSAKLKCPNASQWE
jgi:hypothetical protein